MESIDRLREYVHGNCATENERAILRMADAIEREVEEKRIAAYNEGYDAGFASADDWAAQHEDAMAEHGWVRLPVDADGEPIHVGDVMEWCQGGNVFTVTVLGLVSREWEIWGDDADYAPDECRHHHAPTVEDVLAEFADEVWNRYCNGTTASDSGVRELEAEYAAKLRLAGDE